ncbi:MAG: ComEC/Rec2 family competence protein, partial [Lachnospiraceae bacterium]|nr:ComEC/Rec2 family competence protein [Lachnospiraceae bacterium]
MEKKYFRIKRPLALFCVLFLLIIRLILWITGPPDDPYEGLNGDEVAITGKVVKKEHKNGKEAIYLKEVSLTSEGTFSAGDHQEYNSCGLILYIKTDEATDSVPLYGSRISVQGKVSLFREARNPGAFDMRGYYLCKGFGAAVYPSDDTYPFEYVSEEYSVWKELLWRVRLKLEVIFSSVLDEEDAGVMRAMLLGDKSELSQDLKSLYQMSGIAHILAISGLHISIIGMGLYRGLRKMTLPVLPAAVTGALIMTAYAQMTGSGTSTIRAVTMFLVMVVGDSLRKSYDLPTALALSAFTTVFTDPYEIMTSGFLLSYGAVFGIAVFFPSVKGNIRPDEWLLTEDHSVWGKFVRKAFDAVTGGICVTAFTMPLIAATYYEIPVYSFVLNLLVVPLMTILMCAGILILIAGTIFLPAAYMPAAVCHAVLAFYRLLCETSSSLPFSHFICGSPNTLQIIICYAVFISVVVFGKKWKMIFRVTVIPAGLMLLFFRAPRGFGVTMLDVGQGDGICIADRK